MNSVKYISAVALLAMGLMSGCAAKTVNYSANDGLRPVVEDKSKPYGVYNVTAVFEIDNSNVKTLDSAKTAEAEKEVHKAVHDGMQKRGFKTAVLERELLDEETQKRIMANLNTNIYSPLVKTSGKTKQLIPNAADICKQKGTSGILLVKGVDFHQSAGRKASEAAKTVFLAVLGGVRTVSKAYTHLQVMLLDCEGRQVFSSNRTDTGVDLTSGSDAESFVGRMLEDLDEAIEKQQKKS